MQEFYTASPEIWGVTKFLSFFLPFSVDMLQSSCYSSYQKGETTWER